MQIVGMALSHQVTIAARIVRHFQGLKVAVVDSCEGRRALTANACLDVAKRIPWLYPRLPITLEANPGS